MEAVSWLRGEMENKFAITTGVPGHDTNHTNAVSKNSTFVRTGLNHFSLDRPGLQFEAHQASHHMPTPQVAEKSWSSAQQLVALSSGEAALYALVKGASRIKSITSMHMDCDQKFGGKVCTDAAATVGISFRRGLSRTRHLDVQCLRIQEGPIS